MPDYKLDELIVAYERCRLMKAQMGKRHAQELASIEAMLDNLTETIWNKLEGTGQEMARTKFGTARKAPVTTASCADDPNGFLDFVIEKKAWDLIDRRANVTACQAYLTEYGTLPTGVKLNTRRKIGLTLTAAQRAIFDELETDNG